MEKLVVPEATIEALTVWVNKTTEVVNMIIDIMHVLDPGGEIEAAARADPLGFTILHESMTEVYRRWEDSEQRPTSLADALDQSSAIFRERAKAHGVKWEDEYDEHWQHAVARLGGFGD